MVNLQNFEILFDNPLATYNAGQTLSGTVFVQVDRPKKIRGIELHVLGLAEVKWTKEHNKQGPNDKTEKLDEFSAQEQYYSYKYYVVGNEGSEMVLPVGENQYKFTALLPESLPSSFEGTYGHIRYTVRARLVRPLTFDQETKAVFTVIFPLDLNTELGIQDGRKMTREKSLCCWCCKSGPISMTVKLSCTGFVPGQSIPLTVEVDNNSDQEVSDVTCKLIKTSTFRSQEPQVNVYTDKVTVASLELGSVDARGSQTFHKALHVPSLPPSYLRNCSIIDLNYKLLFEASFDGPHLSLDAEVMIVIGTIPLSVWYPMLSSEGVRDPNKLHDSNASVRDPNNVGDSATGLNKGTLETVDVSVDMTSDVSTPLLSTSTDQHSNIPPPVYTECIQGPKPIEDSLDTQYTMGDKQFVPKYPMYSFNK